MRQIGFIAVGILLLFLLGLNLFLAYQLSNALFLAPSIAIASILTTLYHRPSWFILLIFLIFFDVRGELAGTPIHLWEIYLLVAALPLLIRSREMGFNRLEIALFILFCVAVLSAFLNSSFQLGLKSAARWLEYLIFYRTIRIAAAPLFSTSPPVSLARLFTVPIVALALFSIVQATVIKSGWVRILQGPTGALLMGPTEAKVRTTRNNFAYTGEHSEAFRAPGLYLSAVDLSAVLLIAVVTLYITGRRSPLLIGGIVLGGIALIFSMGRASLLYGIGSISVATLLYQRRAKTLLSLLGLLLVLALALLAYAPARERLLTLADKEQNSEGERLLIWQTGMNIWKSSPIYGKGGGSTSSQFDENASADWLAGRQGSTHSTYVGTLAELGGVGLVAWLYFLWLLRRDFVNFNRSDEAKALLCFCWCFFILMGISSDTYSAGNPYFLLLLLLFGWHSGYMVSNSDEGAGGMETA